MPRDFASVNLEIWSDPDFRALPPAPQHLYLTLWTQPALTYAGTHDWRPGRLSGLSKGWTGDHIQTVADCLTARHFFVIDYETEEVLIRSWVRFDGLMKQPRMAISYVNAYASVASDTLRAVLVHETQKIQRHLPELACWQDERVQQVLAHPSISAKELPCPQDPFGDGFGGDFGLGLPQTRPGVWGSVSTPPTPAPTPAPTHLSPNDSTRKRVARRLPSDFEAKDEHHKLAAELGVDLPFEFAKFRDYWIGEGKTKADWDATLRNWLRRAGQDARKQADARLPVGEGPDDWMRR